MKNFLILVLSLALAAAAFFTRPTEAQFRAYLKTNPAAIAAAAPIEDRLSPGQKIFKVLGRGAMAEEAPPRDYVFRDCYLWVDVRREGKTVYVGAFAHFLDVSRFERADAGEPAEQAKPAATEQPAPVIASTRSEGHRRAARGSW